MASDRSGRAHGARSAGRFGCLGARGDAGDRGAVVLIVAAALAGILLMAAFVLDYSAVRRDREADQVAADAMALAASQGLGGASKSADVACWAALDYITVNLPSAASVVGDYRDDCTTTFGAACTATTAVRTLSIPADKYTITFTHPVPAGSALLDGRAITTLDGTSCQRFGVSVRELRKNSWASASVDLDAAAVSRYLPGVGNVNAPLVLLADDECEVLDVGGSSKLTVQIAESNTPANIVIDSTGDQCGNKVVFNVFGSDPNGKVMADKVSMWAITSGNGDVAARAGLITPQPVAASAPVGRSSMDWRYNCSASNLCPGSGPAYLDELNAAWGGTGMPTALSWMPGSFTRWTTTKSCSGLSGNTVVPKGNWYIDCPAGLSSNGRITFKGGNLVADGPIRAAGGLRVNCPGSTNADDFTDPTACGGNSGSTIYYLRDGNILESGGSYGSMDMRQTFGYLANGTFDKSGNQDVLWTAPSAPDHPFEDLLLWTDSTAQIKITGTPSLQLEGTIFAPNAPLVLAGNMDTHALNAQLFVFKATIAGNAQLNLSAKPDRMTAVGRGRASLIR
jgi:hypothetical protein